MKALRKALEEAHSRFNTAETESVRLKRRVDEISTKLSQLQSTSSRLEIDVKEYATSGEPLDALAGKARTAAREAALRRTEADAELMFLESALRLATEAWNRARAQIVMAEREVRSAQEACSLAQIDECIAELWRNNRALFRKLVDATHVASYLHLADQPEVARMTAIYRLEEVIEGSLAPQLRTIADGDDSFYSTTPDATALMRKTTQLSSEERGRLQPHLTEAQIIAALNVSIEAESEAPVDIARAQSQISFATKEIASKHETIANMDAKRGRWWGGATKDARAQILAEIEHLKTMRDNWTKALAKAA